MSASYFCAVEAVGSGDLLLFRDAAITYAACRRQGETLRRQGEEHDLALLDWLGLDGVTGEPSGIAYLDPSRTVAGVQVRPLPDGAALSALSLDAFRREGFVAEALFSALIRSSYGPYSPEFLPTRSELGFYFDDALLLDGPARWDEEYLRDCQAFFMEELTPAELVEKSLACLDWPQGRALSEPAARFSEQLHGVAFLLAAQLESLTPLARLLQRLLSQEMPAPGLGELLTAAGSRPSRQEWKAAWDGAERLPLASALCPDFVGQAEEILFTAGPDLLSWRAGSVARVSP